MSKRRRQPKLIKPTLDAIEDMPADSRAELLADLPDAVAGGLGKPWPDGTGAPGPRADTPTTPCALCGGPIVGLGHNPQPLAQPPARCCDTCNSTKVVPARLGRSARGLPPRGDGPRPLPSPAEHGADWQRDVDAILADEPDTPANDVAKRMLRAEGPDLAGAQLATPGQRYAARETAIQGDLPGAEQPGGQAIPQQLVDSLGTVYTPGDGSARSSMADALAAERYAELAAQATEPGYRGGGELAQAGPPPTSYTGGTAPPVRAAADVADLRNWMVRQWQPGGLYYRASAQREQMRGNTEQQRADFVAGERQQLQRAALYWTAPAMVDLLTAVAPSTPADVRPVDLVWPDPCGLVVFATPIAGTDSLEGRPGMTVADPDAEPGGVRVDAICWASTRIPDASAPGGRSACLSVSSYRLLDFGAGLGPRDLSLAVGSGAITGAHTSRIGTVADGPHAGSPTASLTGQVWAPLGRSDWPLLGNLAHQDSWIPDGAWPSFREDRQLVAALFTLLSDRQVLLAEQHPAPMPRPQRRRVERDAAKAGTPVRDVVVVTLRQPKRQRAEPTDAPSGRTYTHQWYVKATIGWRWCGPGKQERRLVPIRGHVKGPEGAPFVTKTRVNAWVK